MKNKNTQIRKICDECNGEGYISSCCNMGVNGNQCSYCGKFTKKIYCNECYGGEITYKLNDYVRIYVGAYSNVYLHEKLYNPKHINDSKTFEGKILEIIDDFYVKVMIIDENDNDLMELKLNIEDIEIN